MNAPDWFTNMPIITAGPTIVYSLGILWFVRHIWRAILIEAEAADREENP